MDYSAAETLRSVFSNLKGKGVHLVVAQVMVDGPEITNYQLRNLFGDENFYATLDDVLKAYRKKR